MTSPAPVYIPQPTLAYRPSGLRDSQGNLIQASYEWQAFQGVYSGTNLIYSAFARPGASVDAPVWQISKLTYDGSGNVISITWPHNLYGVATSDYEFVFSNYAGYTYS